MRKLSELRQARSAKVTEMRALLDAADREKRDLNQDEQGKFDELKGEIETLEARIAQAETLADAERRMDATLISPDGDTETRSWGQQAAEAPEVRTFMENRARGSVRIELRAVTSLGGSGGVVAADRRPGIVALPQPRLFVRNLLPVARTTSDTIQYVRETVFTNNAAPVVEATGAEGVGVKPESDLDLGLYSAPVQWIAHVLTVSRQALDDVDQLRTFIDVRMRDGLAAVEEAQLLSGNGTTPNLQGLIGVATAYQTSRNVAGDKRADVVHHAIAQLADIGIAATGIVLNLADWMKMLEQKDANGQYLSQGPFGTVDQPRLWGLPVAATPSLAAGSFLVGDFARAATLYDRMTPEVLLSTEHLDYFRRNLVLVRAEQRIALAIPTPQALVTGTFGAITA